MTDQTPHGDDADPDPGEALQPGSATDVPHDPPTIGRDHPDYVEPAADVEPLPGDHQ